MNSTKNEDTTVPKGWILCSSKSNPGRKYYFNRKTGKSSWTKPQDDNAGTESPTKKRKRGEKVKEKPKKPMATAEKVKQYPQKNLKRKSDGRSTQESNKKNEETPTTSKEIKKQKLSPGNTPQEIITTKSSSPVKNSDSISRLMKKYPKPTPQKAKKKNIANARMSRLRADISSESIEDTSPKKTPDTSITEKQPSKELKSPNLNDSKGSTQSPNDSQTTASPSQFFAATKIITSMKAQLQEEYNNKEKPKDSFADIEQGINNQVTEYPYMKHPATPPQFSEASKLVSAIKSKLTYKAKEPQQFKSASERLETFRRSLGAESMEVVERTDTLSQNSNGDMEVDVPEPQQSAPVFGNIKDSSTKDNIVLVVDTNIFIQELDFIKNVMNSHIKGFPESPTLLVPWRVINELDKLKDSNNGNAAICKRARPAMNYLYKSAPENNRIKVSKQMKYSKQLETKVKEKPKKPMATAEKVKQYPQKNLKRKSDGRSTQESNKKNEETPTTSKEIKKQKLSPGNTPQEIITTKSSSPVKNSDSISRLMKKYPKPTPQKAKKKNIANARMSRLRADISSESIEDTSPKKTPDTSITEKQPSKELKSPNLNDSKGSTQSPNDSQTTASPSQFFAATKIITSMKAQLQEEYNNKEKPKDSFADIEQGINNQVTEYPYMKHPATPPQFSEASKLVSAIKSKLTYKAKEPQQFKSASERLETFRRSLGAESMEVVERTDTLSQNSNGDMEVDVPEPQQSAPVFGNIKDSSTKDNIVLVVDTNIFIQELDFIKNVMNSHIKGFPESPTLLVPWRVINELDKLKDSNNGNAAICKRARPAMNYLYKSAPENNRIKVQPLRDANSHIYPCESPDDEILNCCLQQAERGKSVILLSNDKNLCTKAVANGVQTRKLRELELEQTSQPHAPPDEAMRVQKHIYTLLANILENEMRAKYNNLWLHVVSKPPPWRLADVLSCLLKHWIAVFHEVFPRIEHLITELRDSLQSIEKKASKNITQYELSNFKDLCVDVAKHCQIIPEYMELAKKTVVRLQRERASDSEDETEKDGDNVVVEAFEGVWTVFSSYCAKLATGLGIPHSIEDTLPSDDSLQVLMSKLPLFDNHIVALTHATRGVLEENQTEQDLDEHISRLDIALKSSLSAIGVDGAPLNKEVLTVFSTKCRVMLQEAHSKFSQLVDLLQVCRNRLQ